MPTKTKTDTPTRTETNVDPDKFYNPERLCPSQRDDAERFSRP
jgi:hypothetical protein